jgi:hypothetical protein
LGIWVVGYFLIASPLDAQTPAAAGDGAPELSAITQSAPPDNHFPGFKVHHFRG